MVQPYGPGPGALGHTAAAVPALIGKEDEGGLPSSGFGIPWSGLEGDCPPCYVPPKTEEVMAKVERALISVSDKTGVVDLSRFLTSIGVEILSSGGTARLLRTAGLEVIEVSSYTGFPELLSGRVKTLHPLIHGGILADRSKPEHLRQMAEHGIRPIDMVVVNLYPFQETVSRGASLDEAIEQIDIGGPTLIRAAAKNFKFVAVVVDPADYPRIEDELRQKGEISLKTRLELAQKAFWHTHRYDGAIAEYLQGVEV